MRYLLDSTLTTEAISEKLSYSDAANFRHAFKRWTGVTPKAFRAPHRVGEPAVRVSTDDMASIPLFNPTHRSVASPVEISA